MVNILGCDATVYSSKIWDHISPRKDARMSRLLKVGIYDSPLYGYVFLQVNYKTFQFETGHRIVNRQSHLFDRIWLFI